MSGVVCGHKIELEGTDREGGTWGRPYLLLVNNCSVIMNRQLQITNKRKRHQFDGSNRFQFQFQFQFQFSSAMGLSVWFSVLQKWLKNRTELNFGIANAAM